METEQAVVETGEGTAIARPPARSLAIAERGIATSRNFKDFMSALMTDIVSGSVTPSVGNAACNAGGKLLKVVELEQKYGVTGRGQGKYIALTSGDDEAVG